MIASQKISSSSNGATTGPMKQASTTHAKTNPAATAARLRSSRRPASPHRLRPRIGIGRIAMGSFITMISTPSIVPDARVEQPVRQIDDQIEQDDQHAV